VIKRQHTKVAYQCCISAIEATYHMCISVMYINNRGNISEVYFSKVS
jgi:hypothetical protein